MCARRKYSLFFFSLILISSFIGLTGKVFAGPPPEQETVQLSAQVLWKKANDMYERRSYDSSRVYFEKTEAAYKGAGLQAEAVECIIRQAWASIYLREFNRADQLLNTADVERLQCCPEDGDLTSSYFRCRIKYHRKLDQQSAVQDYLLALIDLLEKERPDERDQLARQFNRLGISYISQGEYQQAAGWLRKALENITPGSDDELDILNNLAVIERRLGNIESSLEAHQKIFDLRKNKAGAVDWQAAVSLYNISVALADLERYDEAMENLETFLELFPEDKSSWMTNSGKAHTLLAEIALQKGENKLALQQAHRALVFLADGIDENDPIGVPSATHPNQHPEVVLALNAQATALFRISSQENDFNKFRQAWKMGERCLQLIDSIRINFREEISRSFFLERVQEVFAECMERNAYGWTRDESNKYLESAWHISEKNKYLLVLEGQLEYEARIRSGLSQNSVDKLTDLERKLALNYRALKRTRYAPDSWTDYEYHQSERVVLHRQWDALVDSLERTSDSYRFLKRELSLVSSSQFAKTLAEDEAAIAWFSTQGRIYSIVIAGKVRTLSAIDLDDSWYEALRGMRRCLSDKHYITNQAEKSTKELEKYGWELYSGLLQPTLERLPQHFNALLLMPDGAMSLVPFETYLTKAPGGVPFTQMPWLIRDYRIRYGWSGTLLTRPKADVNKEPPMVIAPAYSGNWNPLPSAERELHAADRYFMADKLEGENAVREAFLEELTHDRRLLHLIMHAVIDSVDPMASKMILYGSDSAAVVYAWELYNMKIPVDMVLLSACETASGTVQAGEGVMSLARAFAHAGSSALMASMWKVDDKSSAGVVRRLYKYLSRGKPKSHALRRAKLLYLEEAPKEFTHPYYWSTYIIVGDNETLSSRKMWSFPYFFIAGLFVLLLVMMAARKRL